MLPGKTYGCVHTCRALNSRIWELGGAQGFGTSSALIQSDMEVAYLLLHQVML